jgi:hypothetical protein
MPRNNTPRSKNAPLRFCADSPVCDFFLANFFCQKIPPPPLPHQGYVSIAFFSVATDMSAWAQAKRKIEEAASNESIETKRPKTTENPLSVVDTADGGLDLVIINDAGDIIETTHILKETVLILKRVNLNAYENRKTWKLNSGGYVVFGFIPIHRIMGDLLSDDEARDRWAVRFAENPYDALVVGHLDDNPINFNLENLEKIPEIVNLASKKSQPRKTSSNKFFGEVGYNSKRVRTKTVDTEAEALFLIDATKLEIVPEDMRPYLLKHAMWRPKGYEDRYASVEKMLAFAGMYVKRNYKKPATRESKNTYTVYKDIAVALEALPDAHSKTIKDIFAVQGIVPFDAEVDAVVYYVGALGKQIVFVVNYDFYANNMAVLKPAMKTNQTGYLLMVFDGKLSFLHLKIMERNVGQSQKDGLCGGHGAGKVLDNRARVLKPLTPAENRSDAGNVLLQTAPGVVGVSWHAPNGKWLAKIQSFLTRGDQIYLGLDDDKAVAASWYAFANANKAAFKTLCETLPDAKTRNNYIRACCVAQAMLKMPV